MIWLPFKIKRFPKSFLGIDIGTMNIRVVELGQRGKIKRLENYGEIQTASIQKAPFRVFEKNTLLLSNKEVAQAIRAIIREAGIRTKEVNFSIPDFSSFFTSFELPAMSEKELSQAIRYEARSFIPLPLSEITLDWSLIEGESANKTNNLLKILVVAIPNEVINQYREIAFLANLEMRVLEAETFALARAAAENNKKTIVIVDIGARSTTINILDKGILKISHSFNISGNELTETIRRSLKINYENAEQLKKNFGLIEDIKPEQNVREILLPLIDSILNETKKVFQSFYQQENKEIEKVILAGGTALMAGLKEYFFKELKKETEIINPFLTLNFPPILTDTLKEMGPSYAIAVGLALKGFE